MNYRHLSLAERHYIEIESKSGTSLNTIVQALHRSQSTVSREINRNIGQRGYRHNCQQQPGGTFRKRTSWQQV